MRRRGHAGGVHPHGHGHVPPGAEGTEPCLPREIEDLARDREVAPREQEHEQRRDADQRRRHQRHRRVGEPGQTEQHEPAHEQRGHGDHRGDQGEAEKEQGRPSREAGDREAGPRCDEDSGRDRDRRDEERVEGLPADGGLPPPAPRSSRDPAPSGYSSIVVGGGVPIGLSEPRNASSNGARKAAMTSTTPTVEIPERRRSRTVGPPIRAAYLRAHPVPGWRRHPGTGYDSPSFRPLALAGSPGRWEGTMHARTCRVSSPCSR